MGARALIVVLMLWGQTVSAREPYYQEVADYAGVPVEVLYAMAVAESGRYLDKRVTPWPWSLNIEGTAKRFETRDAMFEGLIAVLQSGRTSVDIGPMQVNWFWQYERFGSPWLITDPIVNLKVGASILREQYDITLDWREAVGRYHRPSQAPDHKVQAEKYIERVEKVLGRSVGAETLGV